MAEKDVTFLSLEKVVGLGKRQNDILFSTVKKGDISKQQGQGHDCSIPAKKHVVFFPGDVQNFHRFMTSHSTDHRWIRWSYENTSTLLHQRFPNSYVWVIKPSRIHEKTFSCYDNFLSSTMFGAPAGFENFDGLSHLCHILLAAIGHINTCEGNSLNVSTLSKVTPLTVVGFSKGCVVLNQFLYELEFAKTTPDVADFLKLIDAIYWLDAGHSLTSRVWITEEKILQQLTDMNLKIRVHVTPRQVRDPVRPHIREEERLFVDLLKHQGADVEETLHFADEERSMEQHFRVLEDF